MGANAANLGELVDDDADVYRAFSLNGHRKNQKVRAGCFYRRSDHHDGISVGLTPENAVADLDTNYGYCKLSVGRVHALPYQLRIRVDPQFAGHALIHNVPCIDSPNDDERKEASLIAGELARVAELVTNEPFYPQREGPEPLPVLP